MKNIILLLIFCSTAFSIYPQKFFESFESTSFPPSGWTIQTFGGSGWSRQLNGTTPVPGWVGGTITTPPNGGNAVAYCTWGGEKNDQWLISPQIQNILATDTLYFAMRRQFQYADTLQIWISENTNSVSDFNLTYLFSFTPEADTNWYIYFVPIGELISNSGVNIHLAFVEKLENNQENGGALSIDLVTILGSSTTYPQNIQLSKTFSFGNPENKSSYRLVGIPGNNNTSVTTFFKGEHKKDWNVFYDNGTDSPNSSDYLIEFNGQATFNFTPGKGFWALSRNPVAVSGQVNTVALLANNTFNIPLHSGWNIISNPFEKSVSVEDIRNSNNLPNAVFYTFTGNFSQVNSLAPYEGYYFMNPDGRPNLSIPYPFGTSLPKENSSNISSKSLKLKLTSSEFSSEVIAAFDETAKNDYDDKDYFAPPGNFEEVNIRLVNENLSTSYKQLFIEHRPEIGEGQVFDVVIKNTTGRKIKLISEGIEKFNEHEVFLVDERLKNFYNLKENNEINISGNHQKNEFKLLIGKQNFINNFIDNSLPKEFALYQNYPNPFNPSTIIRFQVPQKEHITIKVYDILGNLVKVLLNEIKDTGYYEVEFNGSSLSSGIYFCEFSGGSVRDIKKMTLIK